MADTENKTTRPPQDFAQKIEVDGKWHWVFKNWTSKGYEYLEERPWTPQIIDAKLCFSAKENNKWKIIWGDKDGQEYDDVFDLVEFKQTPLYVARDQNLWFLVRGEQESKKFPFQITYRIEKSKIEIHQFQSKEDSFLGEF